MRILLLLASVCSAALAQQASVEGMIVDASTHQALPGVHLTLFSFSRDTAQAVPDEPYGAISGKDGHYSIAHIKPAAYVVTPQKSGFVLLPGSNGATAGLNLKAGENRTGLVIEMTPKAAISGRVTDENGDPVQHAQISAVIASGSAGQPIGGRGMNGQTDERGLFRITGAPGKYFLSATRGRASQSPIAEVRSDGTEPAAYALTFYPAAQDKTSAAAVEAVSGRETSGVDIRLIRQRSLSIHGVVSGIPSNSGRAFLVLWPQGEIQQQVSGMKYTQADADGKFTYTGLGAATYNVWARFEDNGVSWRSQSQTVRLDAADVNSLDLRLTAGEEIAGMVEGPASAKRTIRLEQASGLLKMMGTAAPPASVAGDGSFRLSGVFPDRYKVIVEPLPENGYVKSVRLDAGEMPPTSLDLTSGVHGAHLRVTLSDKAAALEGVVLGPDGKPAESPLLYVGLAASADDLGMENMKQVRAGAAFSFKNVRPGKYRLFVMDPSVAAGTDSLRALYEKADAMEFKEGDKTVHDLKLGGKEASGGK